MRKKDFRFIAYDKERILQPFVDEFSSIYHFSCLVETDLETLGKTLFKSHLDAFFLVENDSSEALSTFLKEFQPPRPCLVYIAKNSSDSRSFRRLKTDQEVDYVVQQPLDKNEISALFSKLCGEPGHEKKREEYLTLELLEKYQSKIFEKIERIETLIQTTATAQNPKENLQELRNEIHKISGNAAPYGYPEAGKLCSIHEAFLHHLYSSSAKLNLPEIVQQNDLFLRKLKLFFQNINPDFKQVTTLIESTSREEMPRPPPNDAKDGVVIHLVTNDFDLAHYFETAAAKKNLLLEHGDNPDAYLKKYSSSQKIPHIILTEEHFPSSKLNGLDLIRAIQSKQPQKASLFVMMTDYDTLEKRLSWMESGVDLVLKKPITAASVEYLLSYALKRKTPVQAKILIVDDDETEGLLVKNILDSNHISSKYLQDETKLFSTIEEYEPDLLLLDIQMPKYSGKLLLSALREDIHFKDLLIVVATALEANDFDEWAYHAKCDAIIHKPINVPIFLACISNLLARRGELTPRKEYDPLSGLLLQQPLLQRMEQFLSQTPDKTKCAFTLIKIDHWENLVGTLKIHEVHKILLLFSELLKTHFFSCVFMGIYVAGCFALLFKDLYIGEVEFLLKAFYEKIGSKTWLSSQPQLKINAVSSVVLFESKEIGINQIIDEAKKGLFEAQNGKDQTVTRVLGEKISSLQMGKNVILVDDDLDICEIVHFAFEKHGFSVKCFQTAAEALHYFAQLPHLERNTLLILDRKLPDGDGIDVLRKVQEKFPASVKAIFLSSLSSEQEILDSLRSGGMDYITKPFSMEVLIEKASILLSK